MKKVFAVLAIVAIIIVIAGCGGGASTPTGQSATPASPTATTGTTQSASPGATGQATTPSSSTQAAATAKTVPRKLGSYSSSNLPAELNYDLENSIPTVIAFYSNDDRLSERVKNIVETVTASYSKQVAYNYFTISINQSSKVANLANLLDVEYAPHISIIDRDKNIVFEKSGLIDQDFLKQAVYNVTFKSK